MLSMQSSPGAHSASDEFSGFVSQGPPGVQSFPSISKSGHYPHQDPEHQDEQGQQPRQQQQPTRGGDVPLPSHGAASHHTTDVDNQVASPYQPSTKPLPPAPPSGLTPEAKWAALSTPVWTPSCEVQADGLEGSTSNSDSEDLPGLVSDAPSSSGSAPDADWDLSGLPDPVTDTDSDSGDLPDRVSDTASGTGNAHRQVSSVAGGETLVSYVWNEGGCACPRGCEALVREPTVYCYRCGPCGRGKTSDSHWCACHSKCGGALCQPVDESAPRHGLPSWCLGQGGCETFCTIEDTTTELPPNFETGGGGGGAAARALGGGPGDTLIARSEPTGSTAVPLAAVLSRFETRVEYVIGTCSILVGEGRTDPRLESARASLLAVTVRLTRANPDYSHCFSQPHTRYQIPRSDR